MSFIELNSVNFISASFKYRHARLSITLSMPASHSELGSIYFKGINQIFRWDTKLFNFANDKGHFLHLTLHDYYTVIYSFTTM